MGRVRPWEREEVPMPIVGGLDIHRKQITFDYLCDMRPLAVSGPATMPAPVWLTDSDINAGSS
jgi:hypothetical protein